MSMELLPPPPPGPPPPPPATSEPSKKKLYQAIAAGKSPVEGDYTEALVLLSQRESSFRKDLQWMLFNKYVPSLIQDGPQCGLVALWMAAHLRQPPLSVTMDTVVQKALDRCYTAQGEMFSARDMALLAEEVCVCRAELLSGGMGGDNATAILRHLTEGQPVLIPYDMDFNHEPCSRTGHRAHWAVASGVLLGLEQGSVSREHTQPDPTLPWLHLYDEDFNHEPCSRTGHRAHWAVASGVLLGLEQGSVSREHTQPDPTLPWLHLPRDCPPPCPGPPPTTTTAGVREAYVLAKQGKSLRYQLWSLASVARSNSQLREMDPNRAGDSGQYVVPRGGVAAGLGGQVVLLHTGAVRGWGGGGFIWGGCGSGGRDGV